MIGRRPVALMELLAAARVEPLDILGNSQLMVTGISAHAQRTQRNEMFVAVTGTRIDSHMMLAEAVEAGAGVLVVERETPPYPGVAVVRVADSKRALGSLAHAFLGHPARAMNVCGITATNGKTTTSQLVHAILRRNGCNSGTIGTLGAMFAGKTVTLNTTTPGAIELAEIFAAMDEERVDSVAMEVSSHAIDQARIAGIPFRCGAFINLTQDHLDYHGSMENYADTKKRLFFEYVAATPGSQACFNLDDPVGEDLARTYPGDFIGFSRQEDRPGALVRARNIVYTVSSTAFSLMIDGAEAHVKAPLGGTYNVDNMLAAAACCHSMGVSLGGIADGINHAPPVPGRFEFVDEGQPFGTIIDYAHTPDALYRLLRSARRICQNKLIVVFGCGGDRDRAKRPLMGKIAGDLADFAVVTNDNPRTEQPDRIARQILEGILQSALKSNRYQVVLDRRAAIEQAIGLAAPGDVVVIAGKGHEDYQDVGTTRLPFDDRQVARAFLRESLGRRSTDAELETVTEPLR